MKKLNYLKVLSILLFSFTTMMAQTIQGDWNGTLNVQGQEIPLVFHFTGEGDALTGTLDSPAQGATGLPLDKVTFAEGNLTVKMAQAGLEYVGQVKGKTIEGTFKQGPMELPLTLSQGGLAKQGDTSLPSSDEELQALAAQETGNYKYAVEDFFAKPKASSFQLSPDGQYLSYKEKDENARNHVYIKNVETGEVIRAIEEKDDVIRSYGWASKERLIYFMDKGGNENIHVYSVKIDGTDDKELTPFEGVKAQLLASLKEDPNHIIVSLNKNNPQIFEPYKLNIHSGDLEQLYTNDDPQNPIAGYTFDKDGNLRAFTKIKDGINSVLYYTFDEGKTYEVVKELDWKDGFGIVKFNYASDNPHEVYVVSNLDTDKAVIQLYDFKKNQPIKSVFSHPDYDVADMSLSRHRNYELDYFSFVGEKAQIIPVSDYYKELHTTITKQFPDHQYVIADMTDDESQYLIAITSDKLVGKYYTYDPSTKQFELLYDLMPQLPEEDMASMMPISFESRDGITLHGYLTIPNGYKKGDKVPVIVNPHGGPQGARDRWGFNPEVQLFASRGYATLQVNFRISGGYGRKFMESGYGEIGRKLMDDVEDGLHYIIQEGYVDKDKAAIYGASHGGYAVLRGLTKTPDLYACGVDYVGISNIFTFMSSMPPYWKPYIKMIKSFWYDEEDPAQKEIMKEVSPIFHIDKIKKPLFVIQGANDPRVNINEADQIVSALRSKGINVPYLVKYDEGHGFAKEENRIQLYKTMMGFFAENLK